VDGARQGNRARGDAREGQRGEEIDEEEVENKGVESVKKME
jgi:hypothetical protein